MVSSSRGLHGDSVCMVMPVQHLCRTWGFPDAQVPAKERVGSLQLWDALQCPPPDSRSAHDQLMGGLKILQPWTLSLLLGRGQARADVLGGSAGSSCARQVICTAGGFLGFRDLCSAYFSPSPSQPVGPLLGSCASPTVLLKQLIAHLPLVCHLRSPAVGPLLCPFLAEVRAMGHCCGLALHGRHPAV